MFLDSFGHLKIKEKKAKATSKYLMCKIQHPLVGFMLLLHKLQKAHLKLKNKNKVAVPSLLHK